MATSTLGSGTLVLAGTTSGTTTVTATAVAGTTTLTLPAATDTLVGRATTDTLTNKTLTGAAMNGTVGVTLPSTGAFTTLTSTGASSFATSSGSVGIGISSPASILHIKGAISKNLADESTWGVRVTDTTAMAAGVGGGIIFTGNYTTGGAAGMFGAIGGTKENATSGSATGNLKFYSANSSGLMVERGRFNSTGALVLAGGTTTADGIGITFPATQSASTDANTLDDYEEGTFTVTLIPSTSGTITVDSSYKTGAYTKVGRLVSFSGQISTSAVSSPVGYINLSLPFPIADLTEQAGRGTGSLFVGGSLATTINDFVLYGLEGESAVRIYLATTSQPTADSAQKIDGSTDIVFQYTYFTT